MTISLIPCWHEGSLNRASATLVKGPKVHRVIDWGGHCLSASIRKKWAEISCNGVCGSCKGAPAKPVSPWTSLASWRVFRIGLAAP